MPDELEQNFASVASDGTITFNFTGTIHALGLDLPFFETPGGPSSAQLAQARVWWQDQTTSARAAQVLATDEGVGATRLRYFLEAVSPFDGLSAAKWDLLVNATGIGVDAAMVATVTNSASVQTVRRLLDTLGRSDFLQSVSPKAKAAKGSIPAGSPSTGYDEQAVGADNTVLQASAAAGLGIKWGTIVLANLDSTLSQATVKQVNVRFLLNGTVSYTPTAGTREMLVECIGAGGGGGGVLTAITNSGAAGGGAGGMYAASYYTTVGSGAHTVAIGGGGAGGVAGANPGTAGGDTSLTNAAGDTGTAPKAKGGAGGAADTVAAGPRIGGLGGGASIGATGDTSIQPEPGQAGIVLAAAQALSGSGGMAAGPGGGGGRGTNVQAAGTPGTDPGGGGGAGGCILSGGASVAGGKGANGLMRITEVVYLA